MPTLLSIADDQLAPSHPDERTMTLNEWNEVLLGELFFSEQLFIQDGHAYLQQDWWPALLEPGVSPYAMMIETGFLRFYSREEQIEHGPIRMKDRGIRSYVELMKQSDYGRVMNRLRQGNQHLVRWPRILIDDGLVAMLKDLPGKNLELLGFEKDTHPEAFTNIEFSDFVGRYEELLGHEDAEGRPPTPRQCWQDHVAGWYAERIKNGTRPAAINITRKRLLGLGNECYHYNIASTLVHVNDGQFVDEDFEELRVLTLLSSAVNQLQVKQQPHEAGTPTNELPSFATYPWELLKLNPNSLRMLMVDDGPLYPLGRAVVKRTLFQWKKEYIRTRALALKSRADYFQEHLEVTAGYSEAIQQAFGGPVGQDRLVLALGRRFILGPMIGDFFESQGEIARVGDGLLGDWQLSGIADFATDLVANMIASFRDTGYAYRLFDMMHVWSAKHDAEFLSNRPKYSPGTAFAAIELDRELARQHTARMRPLDA